MSDESNFQNDFRIFSNHYGSFFDKLVFSSNEQEGTIHVHCPDKQTADLIPKGYMKWKVTTSYDKLDLSPSKRLTIAISGTLTGLYLIVASLMVTGLWVWGCLLLGAIVTTSFGLSALDFRRTSQFWTGIVLTLLITVAYGVGILTQQSLDAMSFYAGGIAVAAIMFGACVMAARLPDENVPPGRSLQTDETLIKH